MSVPFRVTEFRQGFYADSFFFTTQIGVEEGGSFTPALEIRDCELKTTKAGQKYVKYPTSPSIKRRDDGLAEYQKDPDGRQIYRYVVAEAKEPGAAPQRANSAARDLKDRILLAVLDIAATTKAEDQGRGAKARPQPTEPVAATTGTEERGNPLESDDSLPF